MAKTQLHLTIVSQEQKLLEEVVDSVTVPTTSGEITVLPGHIPLFSEVQVGQLVYRQEGKEHITIVTAGFLDVQADNKVVLMVDSGVLERDISLEKANAAIKAAHETMAKTEDQRELMLAEASLRRAMLEIKIAEKSKKSKY